METHPVLHEFGQAEYIDCTDGRLRDRGRARIPAGFSSVDWTGGRAVTSGHWSLGAGGRPWHTPSPTHCEPAGSRPAGPSRTKKNNETSESNGLGTQKGLQRSTPKSEETCRLGKEKSAAAYSRVGGRAKMSNHGKDSSRGLRSITRFPNPNSLAVPSIPQENLHVKFTVCSDTHHCWQL